MEPIRKINMETQPLPVDCDDKIEGMYVTMTGLHGETCFQRDENGKLLSYCIVDPWRAPENYMGVDENGQVTDWNPHWDYQVQHCLIKYINSLTDGTNCEPIQVVYPTVVLEDGVPVLAVQEGCTCINCVMNTVYRDDSDMYELIKIGY